MDKVNKAQDESILVPTLKVGALAGKCSVFRQELGSLSRNAFTTFSIMEVKLMDFYERESEALESTLSNSICVAFCIFMTP